MHDFFTVDSVTKLAEEYRALGPLIGFLLPFLESFLPFLPLVVFVIANVNAYGFWVGLLLSWAGTVSGSYLVFLLVRRYGQARFMRFLTKHERIDKFIARVETRGFGPLFLLLCFPFTPTSFVNVVAGLSNMRKKLYLSVLLSARLIVMLSMAYIGYDLKAAFTNPWKTLTVVGVVLVLWAVGKWYENRFNKQVESDFHRARRKDTSPRA